jgi:hypothetical protein
MDQMHLQHGMNAFVQQWCWQLGRHAALSALH